MMRRFRQIGKQFCSILLAMLFVMSMMPMEAKADGYKVGQTCPSCDEGTLYLQFALKSGHYLTCDNPSCQ